MSLEAIGTFVVAAERGSLSAAARALGVPKSTVSRRIVRLEAELGVELVRRTSRTFRLSEAGEVLYRRSAPAVRDLEEAARSACDAAAQPTGELRLAAPLDLGAAYPFASLVSNFTQAYPQVRVSVDLADRFVDLAAEGYDLAIRVHARPLDDRAGLRVRRLGRAGCGLYASPAYLERHGTPQHPAELVHHRTVSVSRAEAAAGWPLVAPGATEPEIVPIRPHLLASSIGFVPAALVADAGIGFVFDLLVRDHLAAGRLVRVLPDWPPPSPTMSVVWPASRHTAPRVRAFLDFLGSHERTLSCSAAGAISQP